MRINLFTFILLSSISGPVAAQAACPNVAGRYVLQWEDGQNLLTITQTGCSSITISTRLNYLNESVTESTHPLRLDGTWQRDKGWFGEREAGLTRAQFNSDTLTLTARAAAAKDTTAIAWRYDFVRLSSGDLCTRFNRLGLTSLHLAARFGTSAASRDSAVDRSGPHC